MVDDRAAGGGEHPAGQLEARGADAGGGEEGGDLGGAALARGRGAAAAEARRTWALSEQLTRERGLVLADGE